MPELPGTPLHAARSGSRPLTAETIWAIPRLGSPAPCPRGSGCVIVVTTYTMGEDQGRSRLWWIPAGGQAGRPLTGPGARATAPAWSPDGSRLAYLRAEGDEKPQVHVLRLDGGESERITDLPLGVVDARWLPHGSGLVVAAPLIKGHLTIEATAAEIERRETDPVKAHVTEDRVFRFWDRWLAGGEVPHLFRIDPAGAAPLDLTPDSIGWFDFMDPRGHFDVSPDGREVAWSAIVLDESDRFLHDTCFVAALDGSGVTPITPDIPARAYRPRYTPGGDHIVYGRTERRFFYADRARLWRYDRRKKTHEPWLTEWDRAPFGWSYTPEGVFVLAFEENARTVIGVLDHDAAEPRVLDAGGTWSAPQPGAAGRVFAMQETLSRPPELFGLPLGGGAPERLTHMTDEALEGVALGEVRELVVEGAEGEPIQTYLAYPPGFDGAAPAPLVQVIHGGPHHASGDAFHFRWNAHLFAAPGYVAAMVNFQGSSSWGTDFAQRIQGSWGDRPYRDIMAVTDVLTAHPALDATRLAAAGGSYGGYMAAWIAGRTDRFRCIVNHAGVYNTLSMYATDVTQGRHVALGGEPWGEIEKIDAWNPARQARGFVTPMLVIHGERDYRVPVTQALECYNVLKAKGVPARLVYFPDENHWILKPHNSVRWYAEVRDWLARYLS